MISRRTFMHLIAVTPVLPDLVRRPREVVVLSSRVAGYRFHDGPANEGRLRPGEGLVLQREPANPHDERAVAIDHPDGFRLGYLPRRCNAVPARLLDQAVPVSARVAAVSPEPAPPWQRVTVDIVIRSLS